MFDRWFHPPEVILSTAQSCSSCACHTTDRTIAWKPQVILKSGSLFEKAFAQSP